jgi:hypothetical protein
MLESCIRITHYCFQLSGPLCEASLRYLYLIYRENVLRLKDVWVVSRAEDLLLLALPFGVVDGVDPVLDFHDEAAVFLNYTRAALVALSGLDGEGT